MNAVFTIVTNSYISHAITLMQSMVKHDPLVKRFVLLVDLLDHRVISKIDEELFEIHLSNSLNISKSNVFHFKYDIIELCTALKPYYAEFLLKNYDIEKLIYFDPDIYILQNLSLVWNSLDDNTNIVLTPHLLTSLPNDNKKPSEHDILKAGVYNLGFIGLRNNSQVLTFLLWWQNKLYDGAIVDIPNNLFTDQRWIDLVPGMFDNVSILRNPCLNMAYWNLPGRHLTENAGVFYISNEPLVFFHFSGYDISFPNKLSKHQDRYESIRDHGDSTNKLFVEYTRMLKNNGIEEVSMIPSHFSQFSDGSKIPLIVRRIVYQDVNLQLVVEKEDFWKNPHHLIQILNSPVDGHTTIEGLALTRLASEIYNATPRLQVHFGDISLHYSNYLKWLIENGAHQFQLSNIFINPIMGKANTTELGIVSKSINQSSLTHTTSDDVGINIIGYLDAESGMGEVARRSLTQLKHIGLGVNPVAINTQTQRALHAHDTRNNFPVTLWHVNADQFLYAKAQSLEFFKQSLLNIGFWSWEMPCFPDAYIEVANELDAIWVGSVYTQNILRRKINVPIIRIRQSIEIALPPKLRTNQWKLHNNKFKFLFSFDAMSIPERKNPFGFIDAFRFAFGSNSDCAQLILKVSNLAEACQIGNQLGISDGYGHSLISAVESVNGILIDDVLDRQQVYSLYQSVDAYVSLHRCEGFGLSLAEMMYLGKPCIATGYSGNVDFMSAANSYLIPYKLKELDKDYGPYQMGDVWAEPSIDDASNAMCRLISDPNERERIAKQGRDDIRANYSVYQCGYEMLNEIYHLLQKS